MMNKQDRHAIPNIPSAKYKTPFANIKQAVKSLVYDNSTKNGEQLVSQHFGEY